MSSHEEIADVLDGAADVIEKRGWNQGGPVGPDGERCALNALSVVAHADGLIFDAERALRRVHGQPWTHKWNDAPERTKQEVLDALRLAAKSERRAADEVA